MILARFPCRSALNRRHNARRTGAMTALWLVALALTGGCREDRPEGGRQKAPAESPSPETGQRRASESFSRLVDAAAPAVVNIAVIQTSPSDNNPLLRDPFFRQYFGEPAQPQTQLAAGSGVIIDARRALVLTNYHVVRSARAIQVVLPDRRRYIAELLGTDPPTDLAVLRLRATNLPQIALGNSDAAKVGDQVLAIGNPFGLGQTVTSGIVSALGRGQSRDGYEGYIQTDAAINPGNSGGALIAMDGTVLGINSAIYGPGANIGIGFAVPAATARFVVQEILLHGSVRRGGIGVSVTDAIPQDMDRVPPEGALIAAVVPGGPAARSGLRAGDLVTAVSGHATPTASALRDVLGRTPIGTTLDLTVRRGTASETVRVQLSGDAGR